MATGSVRQADWTAERIRQLDMQDVRQLRENAERLGKSAVTALCDEVLKDRPAAAGETRASALAPKHAHRLISRSKAFQARGVFLPEVDSSWSGVRKSDGMVVLSLWASAVQSSDGGCAGLLWAPDADGARPWSDTPAGRERLEHCKLALQRGGAEALLVHGEPGRSVYGVDPELVLQVQVERRGDQYWAVWGRKAARAPL